MNTIVIARIFGGLGNQLFIYASARRLSLKTNSELVLDDISGFTHDSKFQRHYNLDHFNISCRKATAVERLEPFSRPRRYLKRRFNQFVPFNRRTFISQQTMDFDPRLLDLHPQSSLYLEGYWQSEAYFKDVEAQIRDDLRIIPPTDNTNIYFASIIENRSAVAIHVRFFNTYSMLSDVSWSNKLLLENYYLKSIQLIESHISDPHYFIFSDCPSEAMKLLPISSSRMTGIVHNLKNEMAYADLWLMSKCKHFIIANSTFSWWGAWLSLNINKIVIAPKFDYSNEQNLWNFTGQLPPEWFTIS